MEAMIFNIQPFSLHDGPGVRTTVFFKGCNLRCYWCHNPESLSGSYQLQFFSSKCIGCGECVKACPQKRDNESARFTESCILCGACTEACFSEAVLLTGKKYNSDELFTIIEKDKKIFESSGGGVTFSGGEPLLQVDFLAEMLQRCKMAGIGTAIETALNVPWGTVEKVLPYIDHIMCDLKVVDSQKHEEATSQGNARILDNIRRLCEVHSDVLVRTPIVPGFNDNDEDISAIAEFLATLPNPPRAELLPFHGICSGKYKSMNMKFAAEGKSTPEKEVLERFANHYKKRNLTVLY